MKVSAENRLLRLFAVVVILAGLAAAAAGHWLFRKPPPKLLTVAARVADLEEVVLASGTIQPRQLVSLGAQASGRIIAMHVAVGDKVKKGQLIAEIDPAPQKNALDNAEAALAQERAQRDSRQVALKFAELAFKRAAATHAQEASSQADYETAEAAYRGAKADVAALDAQIRQAVIAVDTARVTFGYTKVNASIDGTVVAIVTPEGQTVNAVQAAPTIVKVADLETMTIKAQISEADVIRVHPGQKVYFTVLGSDHRYYGTLRTVEPAPESLASETPPGGAAAAANSGQNLAIYYNGLFEIANPEHLLRPSMTAQVKVIVSEAKGALSVPPTALGETRDDGRRRVRVADEKGNAITRWVRVGISDGANTQILEGLTRGERVIIDDTPHGGGPDDRDSSSYIS